MKPLKKIIFLVPVLLLIAGCSCDVLPELRDDIRDKTENTVNEARETMDEARNTINETRATIEGIGTQIQETRESVENKIEDVRTAIREVGEAVDALKEVTGTNEGKKDGLNNEN